jgi:AsmA protein
MRLRTVGIAVAAVVVGLVVAAVAIVSTMDFNQYRGIIAEQVKQATGRDLVINGDLKLALGLAPAVAVNDVTFANAPWGSRPHMAQIKRFEAQVQLLPLVFGTINVKRIVLNDADILLETDKQGRGNWEFVTAAAKDASAPKPQQPTEKGATQLPAVNEVDIRNARLAYRDGKTGQTTNLSLRHATLGAGSSSDPLKLDVDGAFNDLAFQVAGRVGSIDAMSRPGTPFPVNLSGKLADAATFKVDGIVREPLAGKGYELTVEAEGSEISRLARIGGLQMTPVGPFKVEAKIADSAPGGNPSLPAFKAELGKTDLALVKAEGAVRDPLGQKGISINASVEGKEIGAFSGFGVPGLAAPLPPIPALGPFKATAQITNGPGDRPSVPQLKAELGRPDLLKLNVEGSIQDPLGRKGVNVAIAAEAAELRAVAEKAGVAAPISGPFSLAAKVADTGPDRYALSGMKLKAGNSDLSGDATLAMGGARPAITANLASTQVDLAAFMAPQDAKAKPAAPSSGPGAGGGGAAKGGRIFSDDPLPFDLINASDGEMHYQAGKILAQGTTVGDLTMNAVWRNGEFTLKPLTGGLTGGTFAVELGANARAHSMAGKVDVKGVELGTLLQQTGTSDMLRRGKTNFTLDFRGEGRSMRALMASLDGVSITHVGEGAMESRFIDLLGADVVRVLSPLQDSGPQTSLNCVVNRFEIKDGVATPKVMFVDTGKMTISGEGTINLGTEQLAMMLTPRPKQASLVSLAIPIRIGGTLAEPSFSPDTGAALRGAAGAAAGTVLLGPAGVIVPFLSGGQGGSNADLCSQALQQAGLRGAAPAPSGQQRAPSQTQQEQQPSNPVEGIGRGLRGLFGQ